MTKENKSISSEELHKHPDEQSKEAKEFLKKDQAAYWGDVVKKDEDKKQEEVKYNPSNNSPENEHESISDYKNKNTTLTKKDTH